MESLHRVKEKPQCKDICAVVFGNKNALHNETGLLVSLWRCLCLFNSIALPIWVLSHLTKNTSTLMTADQNLIKALNFTKPGKLDFWLFCACRFSYLRIRIGVFNCKSRPGVTTLCWQFPWWKFWFFCNNWESC